MRLKTGRALLAPWAALALCLTLGLPQAGTAQPVAEPAAFGADPAVVDFAFVADLIALPAKQAATIVDSRPPEGGYDASHIPGAISIPDERFEQLSDQLPPDRKQLLVFYCENSACQSSRQSASRAERLGFRNVRIYAAGFADWLWNDGLSSVSTAQIVKLKKDRAAHVLIDARPARTAAKGMLPGAVNIPEREFDKHANKLPADKRTLLIFYCGGIDCPHSVNAAMLARKLGYTNVKTYPEGYPEWVRSQALGMSVPPLVN